MSTILENMTEEDRNTTIEGINLALDKVEQLNEELICRKESIETAKAEIQKKEEEVEIIISIQLKLEKMIQTFQIICDQGKVKRDQVLILQSLTKELDNLNSNLNANQASENEFYDKMKYCYEIIKKQTEQSIQKIIGVLCLDHHSDCKNSSD